MIVSPQNENELADAVRAAAADRHTFDIAGRGTKSGFGRPVEATHRLDLSALSGILKYEPDELVITARAATPIADIESALREKNQCLGFEPADWSALYGTAANAATIGGTLSADACGSARLRYGATRDHLLGYRAVNGLGETYNAGGRVVKNVTGFDLPKLVCGALGTLGPLTEVTLRLVPRASDRAQLAVKNVGAEAGLALLRRVWSSPLEPSGLAYLPRKAAQTFAAFGDVGDGVVLIRIDGAPGPLADKIGLLRSSLDGGEAILQPAAHDTFTRIAAGGAFADCADDVWRVFVPPAAAACCAREFASHFWLADWAGGVLWIGSGDADHVHAAAERAGGHAMLMRANVETRGSVSVFMPQSRTRAILNRRVKDAFDPMRLFNPGHMFEDV
jgi:glycolate oxidase FAD binding subunit